MCTIFQSSLKSDNKNGYFVWTRSRYSADISYLTGEVDYSSEAEASKTKLQRKIKKSRCSVYLAVIVKLFEALHSTKRTSQKNEAVRNFLEAFQPMTLLQRH